MRALVLCAGFGTRLGSLTASTPKPLLKVGGRSLLSLILANLVRQGISEVAVNVHFQADKIVHELESQPVPGATLHIVRESTPLGTLGTAKSLHDYLTAPGPFLLHYGDILTDEDFRELINVHRAKEVLATIAVHRRTASNSSAVIDGYGMVRRFIERPAREERLTAGSSWVFSGIAVLSPAALKEAPAEASDLPRDLLPILAQQGSLAAVAIRGYRCAIDSPGRLEQARREVAAGHCRIYVNG